MKIIVLTVAILLTAGSPNLVRAAKPIDAARAARELNTHAQKSLGVSVRALAFLFDADAGTVLAKNSVSLQRDWKHLESLQGAGPVELRILGGGEYLQIVRTKKGEQVVRALYGP
jgi:hypothetical protein